MDRLEWGRASRLKQQVKETLINKTANCTAVEYTSDRRVHTSENISRTSTDFGPFVRVQNTSGSN